MCWSWCWKVVVCISCVSVVADDAETVCLKQTKDKIQWGSFSAKCYLFSWRRRTFASAQRFCSKKSDGWHIVIHVDNEKNTYLESVLFEKFHSNTEAWIGQKRLDNKYYWIVANTKDKVPATETWILYVPREGEDDTPSNTGDCIAIAGGDTDREGSGWRSRPCDTTLMTICERDEVRTNLNGSTPGRTILPPDIAIIVKIKTSKRTTETKTTSTTRISVGHSTNTEALTTRRTNTVSFRPNTTTKETRTNIELGGLNDNDIIIIVASTLVAGSAVAVLVGIVIVVRRRTRRQLSKTGGTEDDTSYDYITVADNAKEKRQSSYETVHCNTPDGVIPRNNSHLYDVPGVQDGLLSENVGNTYDRANFDTSADDQRGSMYDHTSTSQTPMTSQEEDAIKVANEYDIALTTSVESGSTQQ